MGNNWQFLPHTPIHKFKTSCFLLSPLLRFLVCIGIIGISEILVYLRTSFFCPSAWIGQCVAQKYEASQICVGFFCLVLFFNAAGIVFGERNDSLLQCSCLENPKDGEAWWAAVCGVAQSQTWLEWISSSSSSRIVFSHCPWKLKTEPRYVLVTDGRCLIGVLSFCAKDRHY